MEQSVPKRRHIKFRCRGITQKKEQNMTSLVVSYYNKGSLFPISLVNLILFGNFYTNICTVHLRTVTFDVRQRPIHTNAVTAALAMLSKSDSNTRLVSRLQLTAYHSQLSQLLPTIEVE